VSHQFPSPGQPGEQPPTQVAPQGGQAPGGYPQQGGPGGYPQQGGPGGYPPQGGPGGYPGGGYPGGGGYGGPGGPGAYQAPPTGGGGSKKGLIIGIIAGVLALIIAAVVVLVLVLGGDDDDDDKTATDDTTSETTEDTESPSEDPSTEDTPTEIETSETGTGGEAPTESPTITSQAFLDSLLEGDCLAVEGLSTPDYFQREFKDQAGCKANAGNLEMSNAEYTFDDPVITDTSAIVTGKVYAPNTGKTLNSIWTLEASDGTWLVDGFTYTEG
jgi:hypothetical protein